MIQEELKKQTTVAHQQLEKLVVSRLKNIRSNEDYVKLLRIFYAYFSQLEEVIRPYISAEILPDYAERRHAISLADDIACFGASLTGLLEVPVPSIDNPVKALGALYVMEGSVMGGPIIVQILAKYGITKGTSFFSGYGPETGKKWTAFIDALNANLSEELYPDVINAAIETFSRFADTFEYSVE